VVIDPRRTETAQAATQHLAIQPKSDLTLLYGLANLLIENGWIDESFIRDSTTGFEEFRRHVSEFTSDRVCNVAGISSDEFLQLARTIHEHQRVSFWWTMGVNQSYEGVRAAQAIINLALITGNIGRPGTGANSITGQCNAMGSRLFSNTSDLLGGRDFTSTADRQEVAEVLGIDLARIPQRPSLKYDQILEEVKQGRIKGLWVIATNPAHSWINQNEAREVLCKLDFLVVQDMYASTETAQLADLILPAAAWGEKEGTLINSERRFGVLKKVARAPGEALADFSIFKLLAHYWGCGELFSQWDTPSEVFETMKALSRGRPFDITGIDSYDMIDAAGGIQWPYPAECGPHAPREETREARSQSRRETNVASVKVQSVDGGDGDCGSHAHPPSPPSTDEVHSENQGDWPSTLAPGFTPTERRLFADGRFFTPDSRARLIFDAPAPMPESPCDKYPFLLLTGRGTVSQWHTQTRTSKSAVLRKLYPQQIYFEIHPHDAARVRLAPNQMARIESRRGSILAKAFVTATVQPGQIFIPMHYAATNQLTLPHFDPHSRQPSYKDCAVQVCAIAQKGRRP
jgi:assimilatory nitrate reductase catalytic subunit